MTMLSRSQVGIDLATVLQQAHRGDPVAWEAIFRECYPKVRRVVRRKLNRSMRSLYDSTDFASDVMKSLAANIGHLEFPSMDSLLAFLAQVAEQKVIDEYRRRHTLKRDITRERPILSGDEDSGPVQVPSHDPTASKVAVANEVHERLLSGVDDAERTIIELREHGYSTAEIAEKTGWNIRKVQRFLKDLHDSMEESGG
jgi:RNA polymerase sigma factor (sigma-70 family)